MEDSREEKDNYYERIEKMRNELSKLSQLISTQESTGEVRKLLQQHAPSSSESSARSQEQTDNAQLRRDLEEMRALQIESSQSEMYQQNASKATHNKEEETTAFVHRLESELTSLVEQEHLSPVAQKKLSKKSNSKIAIADNPVVYEVKKPKLTKDHFVKASPKATSFKKSLSSKDLKKLVSNTLPYQKKPLSRVTSGVNFHYEIGKKLQKLSSKDNLHASIEASTSPKLNKLNLNKLKEVMKKTTEPNHQEFDEKLFLNLNDSRPVMQKLIEKHRLEKTYLRQTKRYEHTVAEVKEKSLIEELEASTLDFPYREKVLRLLINFTAQFSNKIDKDIVSKTLTGKPINYSVLMSELLLVLSSLPVRLHKKNYVSQQRYNEFTNGYDALYGSLRETDALIKINRFRSFQLLQALRTYLEYLSKHQLLQTTERKNLYSKRQIVGYYSHRSHKGKKGYKSKSPMKKDYDTQRQNELKESKKVNPKQPAKEIKKRNINLIENKLLKFHQKSKQLSTRSGKFRSPDELRKAISGGKLFK